MGKQSKMHTFLAARGDFSLTRRPRICLAAFAFLLAGCQHDFGYYFPWLVPGRVGPNVFDPHAGIPPTWRPNQEPENAPEPRP
jgi:hypothetical protein